LVGSKTDTPKTPIAQYTYNQNLQTLAVALNPDKEDFDLPEYALSPIKATLGTEELWNGLQVTVGVTGTDGKKSYLSLNQAAANFFPEVLTAAVKASLGEANA
jgi:hypothetical protein